MRWRPSLATFGPVLVGFWAVTSAIATAFNFDLLRSLELQTQTLFFRIRGPINPPNNIVILAMDEDSLSQGVNFGQQKNLEGIRTWPWRRSAYAEVIKRLIVAGARSVALDVVFDAPSNRPKDDKFLQKILQTYAGQVTLAASQAESQSGGGGLEQLLYPDPMFQTQPGSIGFINYLLEPDGQYRRFGWVYLRERVDPDLRQSAHDLVSFTEASLTANQLSFSTNKGDYIYFYGGQNTFPTVSFWHVLDKKNWETLQKNNFFKDKIVLIGPTAALFQDFHFTPFGRISGIEIHANEIATLLEDRAIAEPIPNPLGRSILTLIGIAGTGFLVGKISKRAIPRSLLMLGLGGAWASGAYYAFTYYGLIFPVAVPVLAIALSSLSFLSTGAIDDLFERVRLRRTLERYVASPIVQEILSQPNNYRALLQGRKMKAAVLFCDIRGFTTLSYKLPPEELVVQLNHYLNAMVGAIAEARGTIDKFIGDAIMAEFGCPVSQGEKVDALNAIKAAIGMRRALAELRQKWQEEAKTPFYHGIGISYGEVIAGNIGSLERLEYTVIGDAVNVASRVEGLTKDFGTDILITESLYDLVKNEVEAVFVGDQYLRGREGTTRLYSLIGLKSKDQTLYEQVHGELQRDLGYKEIKKA